MKYSKSIEIPRWTEISEKYKHYISVADKLKSIRLPKEELLYLESVISENFKISVGTTPIINDALLFFTLGNKNRGIHVDGDSLDRSHLCKWGLNIPILNCANAEMKWYNGVYDLTVINNPIGLTHLTINWKEGPYEIESLVIDKPVLVHIDTPHTVINYSSDIRIMLSVRFRPSLML